MIHAYSELYIENAQRVLAQMMHYAVYELELDYDPFARLFLQSGVAEQFGRGNPRYVAGMSGTELAAEVLRRVTGQKQTPAATPCYDRTDAYWTGHTLAWYQWYANVSFRELFSEVPCASIAGMYRKYHEMDLRHAAAEIDRLRRLSAYYCKTGLKVSRERAGLSQRELAAASGVPLRTIQQYEQRQKDLSKASFDTVRRLAGALSCRPEALLIQDSSDSISMTQFKSGALLPN